MVVYSKNTMHIAFQTKKKGIKITMSAAKIPILRTRHMPTIYLLLLRFRVGIQDFV